MQGVRGFRACAPLLTPRAAIFGCFDRFTSRDSPAWELSLPVRLAQIVVGRRNHTIGPKGVLYVGGPTLDTGCLEVDLAGEPRVARVGNLTARRRAASERVW